MYLLLLILFTVKVYARINIFKLIYAFKKDIRNLTNFYRLKNSDFILEIKVAEPNKNKNSKQKSSRYNAKTVILL